MKITTGRLWSVTGLSCVAALGGCGGYKGTEDTGLAVRGYYVGQLSQQIGSSNRVVPAVVIGSDRPGHFQVATTDGLEQFDLRIGSSAHGGNTTSFTGLASVFESDNGFDGLNPLVGQVETEGAWMPGVSLHAEFAFSNGTDVLDVNYRDDIYEQPTTLSQLVGNWKQQGDDGYQLTMSIAADGSASGIDSNGCGYFAQYTALADDGATVDWFHVDENAGCDVHLTGVAVLVRAGVNGNPSDRLVVLTTGEDAGAARGFLRQ